MDCILTPLQNCFWRLFVAWLISKIVRNTMIFGMVERLGGELARIVWQVTIFLLQAFVSQIWIDFTILEQVLEKDHAPMLADIIWLENDRWVGARQCPLVWWDYMQLTMWYCVDWLGGCRAGIVNILYLWQKLYAYVGRTQLTWIVQFL